MVDFHPWSRGHRPDRFAQLALEPAAVSDAPAFTIKEKRQEAGRELAMRKSVYPGWVKAKRMSEEEAARRIAVMAEILADYRRLEELEDEAKQPELKL